MALTPLYSAGYLAALVNTPPTPVNGAHWGGKARVSKDKLTLTAAGTGTAPMVRLPAGKLVIFPDLCRIACPAGVTDSLLHVGLGEYIDADGETQVADIDALLADEPADVAVDKALALPTGAYLEIETKTGVDVTVTIADEDSAASGSIYLVVVWSQGN